MKKITLRNRLRYWFDNTMAKGPIALIGWLFLLSVVLIAAVSLVVVAAGIDSEKRIANANQPRSCIAILADKDKVEMEDEIRARVGAHDPDKSYGVRINPAKSRQIAFVKEDRVIVLAEN